tara:strand:+ start:44 stop:172 length:129 start_codon:yes stop_codon:yes gene_type:complete
MMRLKALWCHHEAEMAILKIEFLPELKSSRAMEVSMLGQIRF